MKLPALIAGLALALAGQAAAPPRPHAAGGALLGAGPRAAVPRDPRVRPVAVACRSTAGSFTITVHPDWAPRGARRFLHLVALHYYDGNAFYRVIPGFVAQWGLSPDPKITAPWLNRKIPDDPVRTGNTEGRVSFATSGRNSRTTEVFVNLGDNRRLDRMGFAPFGEVTSGMRNLRLLDSEYGDVPPHGRGPLPADIIRFGALYLTHYFPRLDVIYSCRVAAAAAPHP
jgi:cyclophilin family peptidyl-prolyl cis-trans isomerase